VSGSDWAHIAAAAVRAVLWILLLSTPVTAGLTLAGDRQPLTLLAGMQFDPTPLIGSWSWTKTIDWGDVHTFIGLDGERVSLGYFSSETQASAAYKAGQKVLAKVSPELARLRARVVDLEAANRIFLAGHARQAHLAHCGAEKVPPPVTNLMPQGG
jgi:hypothetical protein